MQYGQFYVKHKGLNRGYINYRFKIFPDIELLFWFELRYFKAVFCKMQVKGSSFEFVKINQNCHVSMETKRLILAKFMDFDVTPTNA